MVDVPVMRACRFSGAAVEKTFVLPQLQLVEKSDSFYDPSYLAVTCSVCRLWSTGLWTFLGDRFRMVSVFSTLWFDSGYMSASVYEASGRISHIYRSGRLREMT